MRDYQLGNECKDAAHQRFRRQTGSWLVREYPRSADHTFRIYDGDQLLAETGRMTTKPIARFKVRKPETRVSVTRHKDPLFGTDRHIEGGTPVLGRAGGAVRGPGY